MFQSTLAITGERAQKPGVSASDITAFQSTLAITGERAQNRVAGSAPAASFNPRSPLLASEPTHNPPHTGETNVSIHARHYWRASLGQALGQVAQALFQSTLAITGERAHFCRRLTISSAVFQSTLAITGERAAPRNRGGASW